MLAKEMKGAPMEEALFRAQNANSSYKTASKHVKMHANPPKAKSSAAKKAPKGRAKAKAAAN